MVNILVVPTKDYLEHKDKPDFSISEFVNRHAIYLEREKAETDPTHLQLIPYIVLKQNDLIFAYTRLKNTSETRLHHKKSIGIGGHVDWCASYASLWSQVELGAYTELFEEMNIEPIESFLKINHTNHCIYDPSNDVGKVHLGILYTCDVADRVVSVKEVHKISGQFYTIDQIKSIFQDNQDSFETWSTIALRYMGIIE